MTLTGDREILGFAVGDSEHAAFWAEFLRSLRARGPPEMVAAGIRTIFAQPDADAVAGQFERIGDMLARPFPDVGRMLRDAHQDLFAFAAFPSVHWRPI